MASSSEEGESNRGGRKMVVWEQPWGAPRLGTPPQATEQGERPGQGQGQPGSSEAEHLREDLDVRGRKEGSSREPGEGFGVWRECRVGSGRIKE